MDILPFFNLGRNLVIMGPSEWTNCQYLCNWALNKKNKATLFSPTLKVLGTKDCSDLHFEDHWWIYGNFFNFPSNLVMVGSGEFTKWQYLCNRVSNQKTKVTFISSTLKVEEMKVWSNFCLVAFEKKYGHIEFFSSFTLSRLLSTKGVIQRYHFPLSHTKVLYVFGILMHRRMGLASQLIQFWTLPFFAPPPYCATW